MTPPTSHPVRKSPSSRPAEAYLVFYNVLSALLRSTILLRAVQLWSSQGNAAVWEELCDYARWAETLSAIEVIHAVNGLVRAAPATTALQVAGRNTIVWAITRNYPGVAAREWPYSTMLVAWNTADAVRYTYFAVERATGSVPDALLWLRYNMFLVLYPIGFASEVWLVYAVIAPSRARNPAYQYLLWAGIVIYFPAFYILFGHMLAQRAKTQQKIAKTKLR